MKIMKNILICILILISSFTVSISVQKLFNENTLIPAIFVLGAFLCALITDGYIYGIGVSLLSVLAVNYAFTFPYFKVNFTITENLVSAIIMIVITFVTCGLITQIKKQETMKIKGEKEKLRADLLRAVSHDLRTPLTTIYSSASAILENYDNFNSEQKQQMLKGIKDDSRWLTRMVENLLSITRLDGGKVKLIKTETVIDELIDSILIKFSERYPGYQVTVDIPEEFITVPMDAMLIEQVILNLLENSVEHGKGLTSICLRMYVSGRNAVFEVSDNGCGIAKEKLKHIFDGYSTSENTPSDVRKTNAGIGLSVCAAIIRAHGGEIRAQNIKRGGCMFSFTLGGLEDE